MFDEIVSGLATTVPIIGNKTLIKALQDVQMARIEIVIATSQSVRCSIVNDCFSKATLQQH